uniref:histidinol dehydrogenase n=1 Tax=Pseudomonas lurida TaxID=244566 RepID=UPI0030D75F80
AWTWWGQAAGRYRRGDTPRPGAVIVFARSARLPLGHVAVISRVVDHRVVMVTPTPDGEINPLVLAAAHIAGVDEVWRIGGAQAVAALAYGTDRIAPVDVITGPGNAWVAEAKRQLYGVVGIDMVAGPSEIVVVADGANRADWIAADLLSQSEH